MMSHKEIVMHIRKRIKREKINAHCSKYESCGYLWVKISGATPEQRFTETEQKTLRTIAKTNGLTRAQGMEIDLERMTDPQQITLLFTPKKQPTTNERITQ